MEPLPVSMIYWRHGEGLTYRTEGGRSWGTGLGVSGPFSGCRHSSYIWSKPRPPPHLGFVESGPMAKESSSQESFFFFLLYFVNAGALSMYDFTILGPIFLSDRDGARRERDTIKQVLPQHWEACF